ncbi:hypothetical protein ABFS83_14G014400 [Erythranthe nasuta]
MAFSAWKLPAGGGMINKDELNLIVPQQRRRQEKVVVVMGATGTGKSRLSVDLATRFCGEVINSDKMQVYKGLDVATNKSTAADRRGVPHHLIGIIDDPDADFTAADFVRRASVAAEEISRRGRLPIIAGGSNSFVEALIVGDRQFRSRYECCFLWVDVSAPALHSFVSERVDRMVAGGLVEEAAEFFNPSGDYSRGIRRTIGVPELHEFFKNRPFVGGEAAGADLLEAAIDEIKKNTCKLTHRQLGKIWRLREKLAGRRMHRLDATGVFLNGGGGGEAVEAWEKMVVGPSTRILARFLVSEDEEEDAHSPPVTADQAYILT